MRNHRPSPFAGSLSHAHLHARHQTPPAMRLERRSSPPCPDASGETIGTGLELTLSCGASLDGEVLDTIDEAESLEACANFCGTFHPRCDGINFNEDEGCRLIGGVRGAGETQSSLTDDSAVANYPTLPSSSCRDGERTAPGGEAYDAMCGQVINGGDLVQRHKRTYDECAEDCAGTTDCLSFSFEPTMERGFMNCYLKSEFNESALSFVEGVDSGVMSAGNTSSPTENGSEIPNSNGFFSVVPPGNSARPVPSQTSPEPSQPVPEATQTPVVTHVVTASLDSTSASAEAESESASASANLSWVAAPVVGGVAAMLVVGVLLIMFRKRRSGGNNAKAGRWKGMLGLGGKESRGMQRLSDTESRGVPVYEVKGGRMALRNSGDSTQRPMTGLFRTSG